MLVTKDSNTSESNVSACYAYDNNGLAPEVVANFQYGRPVLERWKQNVISALAASGVSFRRFYAILAANGIKISREVFYKKEMKKFPNLLYLFTFSRLLGIETHYLLRSDFDKLLESGEVKPSILGIHRDK